MFDRKLARLLSISGFAPKLVKAADANEEAELICYHQDRGLMGQPGAFYVGIAMGIVFQAALVTISFAMV